MRTHLKAKQNSFDVPPPAESEYDTPDHDQFTKELLDTQETMMSSPKNNFVLEPEQPNEGMEAHENEQALGISEVETNQYEDNNTLEDDEESRNELLSPSESEKTSFSNGDSGMNGMEKQYINEIYHLPQS